MPMPIQQNTTNQDAAAAEDQEPQVMAVKVTNRNDFVIRDMFDGVPFEFLPNIPKSIPIDAANHIFGWFATWTDEDGNIHAVDPAKMKAHVQRRFGWNTPSMVQDARADVFYRNLHIQPIMYRMVPIEVDPAAEPNRPESNRRVPGRASGVEARA